MPLRSLKIVSIQQSQQVSIRHEAIILKKLSIMLLGSAQKIPYYAFENYPLFPKLCHSDHYWLIMPVYCCIIFIHAQASNSLEFFSWLLFHFIVTALLE